MELLIGYLFIFVARVTDVSMSTIRMLMVVQGRRVYAALIGFFEVIIYITALNRVVNSLDNIGNLLAYALGFACGNFVGSYIEEKIALGNLTAQVVLKNKDKIVIDELREKGYGVTVIEGTGREGARSVLNITFKRKNLKELHSILKNLDGEAFMTVNDAKYISGGFFSTIKKK